NAILGGAGLFHFGQSDRFLAEERRLTNERALAELPKLVAWTEARNIYEVHTSYTNLGTIEHVRDWEQFWKAARTTSPQAPLRFKARATFGTSLQPESFRLQKESLGQAAGKDGHDLGAEIDLVGPEAYQRFLKSPQYETWRAELKIVPDP